MKLHIKNKIDLDGQVELVEQSYPVKLTEKMVISISLIPMKKRNGYAEV
jgi:hypothetical protein